MPEKTTMETQKAFGGTNNNEKPPKERNGGKYVQRR